MAELIVEAGAVRLGRFILSSGGVSSVYIDLRILPMKPGIFREAVRLFSSRVRELMDSMGADAVVGVATGGIPWAIGAALSLGIPATYVRLEAKGHGTSRLVEADVRGFKVLVVDDVATTGSSLLRAVDAVEASGASVSGVLVVVDRLRGAAERLRERGVEFYSVTNIKEILDTMARLDGVDRGLLARALEEVGARGRVEGA